MWMALSDQRGTVCGFLIAAQLEPQIEIKAVKSIPMFQFLARGHRKRGLWAALCLR